MKTLSAREYLGQLQELDTNINQDLERLEDMKTNACSTGGIDYSAERVQTSPSGQYIIYPWYYGIETLDLYGEPVTWVCPELERRISEALAVDERITGVTDFEFDLTVKGVVHAYFTVKTIYGDIKAEKGVKI